MESFNHEETRNHFILYTFSVYEIACDEKYGIKFKSGDNEITLVIVLEPEFPYKVPQLSVEPNFIHQWIENAEITKFPGLINVSQQI